MRRYHVLVLVAVLLLAVYAMAFGQGEETTHMPMILGGAAAAESSTPTMTPTATNTVTGDATATNTPTSTPTSTATPTSTPTSTATPTSTPTNTPTSLTVLGNDTYYLDNSGNLILVGQVQNTSSANAAFVQMTAELYGPDNNLLAVGDGIAHDRVIIPGEVSCFRITVQDPPDLDSVASVLYFHMFVEDVSLITGLDVFDVSGTYSPAFQEFTITGKVRNTNSTTARAVHVAATIFDEPNFTGAVVRCSSTTTTPNDIPPNQDATFEVIFTIPDESAIGSYHVEAQLDPTQGN